MSNELKALRKEVRRIAREMLPEVMQHELFEKTEKSLMDAINKRLDLIDERQKQITSFMVRQASNITSK